MRKDGPEREKAASTPECCNCKLLEGEKPHPANYRGCRHAKEELQKSKLRRAPKTSTGRMFTSILTTPGVSFVAALRGSAAQQQQPQACQVTVADPPVGKNLSNPASVHKKSGQSVRPTTVSSQPLNNMLRVVTVVQQFMTDFNDAVSEEEK
jgi:hypothetical protein